MKPKVTAAIASIDEHARQSIRYPKAIWEESELRWITDAQVAEVPFVAFTGLDFFGTPADALVEMLREHVVIEIEVEGHSVTAPDLLFALWRSWCLRMTTPQTVGPSSRCSWQGPATTDDQTRPPQGIVGDGRALSRKRSWNALSCGPGALGTGQD